MSEEHGCSAMALNFQLKEVDLRGLRGWTSAMSSLDLWSLSIVTVNALVKFWTSRSRHAVHM